VERFLLLSREKERRLEETIRVPVEAEKNTRSAVEDSKK